MTHSLLVAGTYIRRIHRLPEHKTHKDVPIAMVLSNGIEFGTVLALCTPSARNSGVL